MRQTKILLVVAIPALAAILIAMTMSALLYDTGSKGASASTKNICKTDLSELSAPFVAKEPDISVIPPGYSLKAVDEVPNVVIMFYSDKEVCPNLGTDDQMANGTIVVMSGPIEWASSSDEMQSISMENFAKDNDMQAKPQAIQVNGFKGYGWEPFEGQTTFTVNGTLVESIPVQMPGKVAWYDDDSKLGYSVNGIQPMSELLRIAASIYVKE